MFPSQFWVADVIFGSCLPYFVAPPGLKPDKEKPSEQEKSPQNRDENARTKGFEHAGSIPMGLIDETDKGDANGKIYHWQRVAARLESTIFIADPVPSDTQKMATCPNCKSDMNTMAASCPHCNYDFPLHKIERPIRARSAYSADLIVGVFSAIFGLLVYFHVKEDWLRGWMKLFGDPPVSNLSYNSLSPFFFAAPYAVSGVVVGLLAGLGRSHWHSLLIRFLLGPVAVGALLLVASDNMGGTVFLPTAIKFFCVSAIVSALYNFVSLPRLNAPNSPL